MQASGASGRHPAQASGARPASGASPVAENEAKLIESGFSIVQVNHSSSSIADSLVTVSTSLSVAKRLQLGSTTDLVSGWSVRLE